MKKYLILFLFVIVPSLSAQFYVGPLGGINVADVQMEDETSGIWTWGAGAVADYYCSENISLRAEVLYANKGTTIKAKNNDPEFNLRTSSIDIPLLFKYEFGTDRKLYLVAGPTFAYTLTSKLKTEINNIEFNADLKSLTEKIDIGATFGAGFNFPIKTGKIFFEARYNMGFTNLAKTGTFTAKAGHIEVTGQLEADESKFKSRGMYLMIGLSIAI